MIGRRLSVLVAVFLIFSLVLVACGDDTDEAEDADTGGEVVTEAAGEATEAEDEATETEGEGEATAEGTVDLPGGASPETGTPELGQAGPALGQVTPPTVDSPPDDELGVVEIAPGEPITLAYALVISGPNESLGIDSRRGIEIAIDDVGGEFLGHPIELVGEDTGCSPEGGQAAATSLATNQQIVAVIGTSCSSEARVAVPVLSEAGFTIISPSNTAPDLTDPDSHEPGYFRTAHNDIVQGAIAAEFAVEEMGAARVATIHDGSLYAEQLANVFADEAEALGAEVVAREAVNVGDTDMRPVLTRIATQEPDFIYYPIFVNEGGFVTRQAREVSGLEDVTLMGADGMFSADFIEAAGDAAVGMHLSSPDFSAFGSGYQEFLEKHQEEYGEAPLSAFHAHAYDAAMMIFQAMQRVAQMGEDGTLYIGRQALRDEITGITDLQGLTGNITCNENGDCADPKIAVYEVVSTDTAGWPDSVVNKVYP